MNFGADLFVKSKIYDEYFQNLKKARLTYREIDVIVSIFYDKADKKVANLLGLSHKTVSAHIHNIMGKIGCRNKEQIIAYLSDKEFIPVIYVSYIMLQIDFQFRSALAKIHQILKNHSKSRLQSANNSLSAENLYFVKCCLFENKEFNKIINSHFKLLDLSISNSDPNFEPLYYSEIKNDEVVAGSYFVYIFNLIKELVNKQDEELVSEICKIEQFFFDVATDLNYIVEKFITSPSDCIPDILHNNLYKNPNFTEGIKSISSSESNYVPQTTQETFFKLLDSNSKSDSNFFQQITQIVLKNSKLLIILSSIIFTMSLLTISKFKPDLITNKITSDFSRINDLKYFKRSEIDSYLTQVNNSSKKIKYISIIGPRGSGKSSIARSFAKASKADLVWEICSESASQIFSSFEELALEIANNNSDNQFINQVNHLGPSSNKKKIMQYIREKIKNYDTWLLIYDDVKSFGDIREFLFQGEDLGNGTIIITSSNSNLPNSSDLLSKHSIEIPELSLSERLGLFKLIIGQSESVKNISDKDLEEFLSKIPPYPLDITIAANYIRAERIDAATYLKYLGKGETSFINVQKDILSDVTEYKYTRYEIISLSIQQILEDHPNYSELLLATSMLSNSNIPIKLLLSLQDEISVREFINYLKKYSLINGFIKDENNLTKYISLHPHTQLMIYTYFQKHLNQQEMNRLTTKFSTSFKDYVLEIKNTDKFEDLRSIIFHLETFFTKIPKIPNSSEQLFIETHKTLGDLYFHIGSYEMAKKEMLKVYNSYFNTLGGYHLKTNLAKAVLGIIYRNSAKYKKAETLLEEAACAIRNNKNSEPYHIAWVLTYLGSIYRSTGKYEESLKMLNEAMDIYIKIHEESTDKERAIMNIEKCNMYLGFTYHSLDELDKAESLLKQSLNFYNQYYHNSNLKVKWIYGRLAMIYLKIPGRLDEAEQLLLNNLNYYKTTFDEDILETAWTMAALGSLNIKKGYLEEAEVYLTKSYQIFEDLLQDADKAPLGYVLDLLGQLNIKKGRLEKAEEQLRQTYHIYENFYGKNHHKTKSCLETIESIKSKESEP